jgi:hypothetical protein
MPTASDLVTDLPADFEVFGQAVATSMADLLGGTTGQVLSKASNTDMDFTWVTSDDANAIQNTIVDAKGDLISATGSDVPARLAVGANGETLVADSSTSTGLRYQGNFAAGKNKVLNSDYSIWQRGTTFTFSGSGGYSADRWLVDGDRTSMGASRQTFTPGTAPVAGYEGEYFLRWTPGTSGSFSNLQTKLEDVRTFAGQTVTLSYWAKCSTGTLTNEPYYIQRFGSGGSADASVALATSTITTTWTRFSQTFTIPSISGKTIGTNNCLVLLPLRLAAGTTTTVDVWGMQLEASNTATAFQTATGTIQGELAACQRYYWRTGGSSAYEAFWRGVGRSTTQADFYPKLPVTMRVAPTAVESSTLAVENYPGGSNAAVTALSLIGNQGSKDTPGIILTVASGLTAGTNYTLYASNSTSAYLAFSAEL